MAFSSIWIGFGGMLAQILLLRLFLSRTGGNELSLGIVSALFLAAEAAGAWAADRVSRPQTARKLVAMACILFALSMPAAFLVFGFARRIFGSAPGEVLSIGQLALLALLLSILPGTTHGASFTLLCRMSDTPPGRIFAWESAGTLVGGVLFSLWLCRNPNEMMSLCVLVFATGIAMIPPARKPGRRTERGYSLLALLFCLTLGAVLLHFRAPIDTWLKAQEFPGKIILSIQSPYATMVLSRSADQDTLYLDGSPYLVFPEADPLAIEESADLPLLLHPEPRNILVIGGGPGAFVEEVLRHHPVSRVDLVEIDPALGRLLEDTIHPPCFNNPAFHLINTDARVFLDSTTRRWDMIFLRISDIDNFQVQRLFTIESLSRMRQHLEKRGMLCLEFDCSFPYIPSEEIRKLAVFRATAGAVFPKIREIPGEHYRILAGNSSTQLFPPFERLLERISRRGLVFRALSPAALRYRLDPPISPPPLPPARADRDFEARSLRAEIDLYCSRYSPGFGKFLRSLWSIPPWRIFLLALLPLMAVFCRNRRTAVLSLTAAAGMLAMISETVLAISFQIAAGALYGRIALLLALFMGGSALGAAWAAHSGGGVRQLRTAALAMAIMHLGFLLLLKAPAFPLLHFSLLSALAGGISGTIYPFAIDALGSSRAGRLYAAEIAGGFAGGILGVLIILGWGLRPALAWATLALLSSTLSPQRFRG